MILQRAGTLIRWALFSLFALLTVGVPSAAGADPDLPSTSITLSAGLAYPVPAVQVAVQRGMIHQLSGSMFGSAWMAPLSKGLELGAVHIGTEIRYEPQAGLWSNWPAQPYIGLGTALIKANLNVPPAMPDLVLRDVVGIWGTVGVQAPVQERLSIDAALQPTIILQSGRAAAGGFVIQLLARWRL